MLYIFCTLGGVFLFEQSLETALQITINTTTIIVIGAASKLVLFPFHIVTLEESKLPLM